jgi:hypothetical protein
VPGDVWRAAVAAQQCRDTPGSSPLAFARREVVPVAQIMALNGYGFGPSTASYPGPGRPSSSRLPLMPERRDGHTTLAVMPTPAMTRPMPLMLTALTMISVVLLLLWAALVLALYSQQERLILGYGKDWDQNLT